MQTSSTRERPTGVVVLVVLELLGAVSLSSIGIAFVGSGFVTGFGGSYASIVDFGAAMIPIGLLGFLVAWGLWTDKRWAWISALALTVVGILIGLYGIGAALASISFGGVVTATGPIIGIFISLFTIYYLTRSQVEAYFRKPTLSIGR